MEGRGGLTEYTSIHIQCIEGSGGWGGKRKEGCVRAQVAAPANGKSTQRMPTATEQHLSQGGSKHNRNNNILKSTVG